MKSLTKDEIYKSLCDDAEKSKGNKLNELEKIFIKILSNTLNSNGITQEKLYEILKNKNK